VGVDLFKPTWCPVWTCSNPPGARTRVACSAPTTLQTWLRARRESAPRPQIGCGISPLKTSEDRCKDAWSHLRIDIPGYIRLVIFLALPYLVHGRERRPAQGVEV